MIEIDTSEGWITRFLCYIRSEKGLSKATKMAYGSDLRQFFSHVDLPLEQIESCHLVSFFAMQHRQEKAVATVHRMQMSLKVFFRYVLQEGGMNRDVMRGFEAAKLSKKIPQVLTQEEVSLLLESPSPHTFLGIRDRAILEMLYGTGIRVSELCDLIMDHVYDDWLKVCGKGGKERVVPLGTKALEAFELYLEHPHRSSFDLPYVFMNSKGKRLDRIGVWKMVKSYAKQEGIEKNISPHTFRHTYATHLLDHGADLRVIQELLGHSDIQTTDRYAHVSYQQLKKKFFAFHPMK